MFATGDYYLSKVNLALANESTTTADGSSDCTTELIPATDFANEINIYLLVVRSCCHAIEA